MAILLRKGTQREVWIRQASRAISANRFRLRVLLARLCTRARR